MKMETKKEIEEIQTEKSEQVDIALKDIVVIYHGNCPDGFGAAFAAWKKFGDEASYLPRDNSTPLVEGLENKEIYILDYSYSLPILQELEKNNKKVVVIDHHKTAKEAVTAFPQNIFDLNHSGCVLAWQYFHPEIEVPNLLLYVEDHDLWRFTLPENREFNSALHSYKMDFVVWDELLEKLKDENFLINFIAKGALLAKFEDKLVAEIFTYREKVLFEGYEIYALNTDRIYRSVLGNHLAELNQSEGREPFGIVYYHSKGSLNISLRSLGDFDVSKIAEKYGGGGHKNASGIRVKSFAEIPFTFIEVEEVE